MPRVPEVLIAVVGLAADIRQQSGKQRPVNRALARVIDRARQRVASTSIPARAPARTAADAGRATRAGAGTRRNARGSDRPARDARASPSTRRAKNCQSASRLRKSERSSRKRRCAWSAACCFSSGRSRGSGTASALAMTSISAKTVGVLAARIIRPMRGSTGSRASSRPSGGQPPLCIDRAEFLQQLIAVGDRARARRFEERKRVDGTEVERGHAQDHRSERAAQDLGFGVLRPRRRNRPRRTGARTPPRRRGRSAPRAGSPPTRDLLDLQQRHLVAQRIALDAREAGVDDAANARHRERGLRNVGREHDAPAAAWREDALLLLDRQPRVERQHLRRRRRRAGARAPAAATPTSRGSRARPAGTPGCRPDRPATDPRRRRRSPLRVLPRRRPRPWSAGDSASRPDTCGPRPRSPAPAARLRRSAARSARRRALPT